MKTQKSFTLIELLVAIGLIGLLATIILVSLNLPERKRQAEIAKSLQFSQSIHQALGADLVGYWSFEDVSGNTARDMSGMGNDGTIYGAVPAQGVEISSGGTGRALSFDGVDDYVKIGNPAIENTSFSVMAWIYPNYPGTITGRGVTFVPPMFYGWGLSVKAFFSFGEETPEYGLIFLRNVGTNSLYDLVTEISLGKWQFAVATYDKTSGIATLYLDGLEKDSADFTTNNIVYLSSEDNGAAIGVTDLKTSGKMDYFNGLIDEVRIYNRVLTTAQIQQHYVQGLARHRDLITK